MGFGLYLHIPYCLAKCRYCDFYSACVSDGMLDSYTESLIREIKNWGGVLRRPVFDTVYFGGGTPSLLGGRLAAVTDAVYSAFEIAPGAEITLELNPTGDRSKTYGFIKAAGKSGVGFEAVRDGGAGGFCHLLLLHPVFFHDIPVSRICGFLEKSFPDFAANHYRSCAGISAESDYEVF